jgi:hypothetical protein
LPAVDRARALIAHAPGLLDDRGVRDRCGCNVAFALTGDRARRPRAEPTAVQS